MRKTVSAAFIILGALGFLTFFERAAQGGSLTSTTYIEAGRAFVLGEGRHGRYRAVVVNRGPTDIEIFTQAEGADEKSLGRLRPDEQKSLTIPEDTKAIFRNLGRETATLGLKVTGDTNLSMGYKRNNP